MVDERLNEMMAQQLGIIVNGARERCADWISDYLSSRKGNSVSIHEDDKRVIEQLFSEAVHTYVIAETAAILSFLLHNDPGNDDTVKQIVPAFLDKYQSNLGNIPEALEHKTRCLADDAKAALESAKDRSKMATFLLNDIVAMPRTSHMRASYNAVILNLLGE